MRKVLPYFFLLIGLVLTFNCDSALCFQSGTFLMLIGCVILMKQLDHRQDQPSGKIVKHT
jgi:hypothetical protein